MSLEQKIEELTAAVTTLTETLSSGAMPAPAEEPEEKAEEEEEPEEEAEEEEEPPKKKKAPAKKEAPAKKAPAKRGRKPTGPTMAQILDKLREVKEELGAETVKELFEEFEVKKASDLAEEDYKEFLEACDEALEEAGDEDEE